MGSVQVQEVGSFPDLLGEIEDFQAGTDVSWYRGCGDSTSALVPSLFRRKPPSTVEELTRLEADITTRFIQRSPPFLERPLTNGWDKLFYMQHYGIPTRLLDWSENPFVAVYFALTSGKRDDTGKPLKDAAFWMCNPVGWNRAALSHISFAGGVLDENSKEVSSYGLTNPLQEMFRWPVMMYGTHNSPRIVAQRGVFALFGQGTDSMETLAEDDKYPDGILRKITISKENVSDMLSSLYRKGVSESVVYPDISGLALEVRRLFGFAIQ